MQRALSFRLIREALGALGWRYKVYVPAIAMASMVFLLPPKFLQFFTGESQRLADTRGDEFVQSLVIFGLFIGS